MCRIGPSEQMAVDFKKWTVIGKALMFACLYIYQCSSQLSMRPLMCSTTGPNLKETCQSWFLILYLYFYHAVYILYCVVGEF